LNSRTPSCEPHGGVLVCGFSDRVDVPQAGQCWPESCGIGRAILLTHFLQAAGCIEAWCAPWSSNKNKELEWPNWPNCSGAKWVRYRRVCQPGPCEAVGKLIDGNPDIQAGINIVFKALEAPVRQIVVNAGVQGSVWWAARSTSTSPRLRLRRADRAICRHAEHRHPRPGEGIPTAWETAKEIRARIFQETDLTASAGISYNKFLAKLASDYRKPNSQFAIMPDEAEAL